MWILDTLSRIVHVGTAITLMGGSIFMLLVLMPSARQLSDESHDQLATAVTSRWKRFVHAGVLLFLLSGFYNYWRAMVNHQGDGLYHALLDEAYQNLVAQLKESEPNGGSTQEKLINFAGIVLEFAKSNPEETSLLFDRCVVGTHGRFSDWEVGKLASALRLPVEQIVAEGKDSGELGPFEVGVFLDTFLSILAMACRHPTNNFKGLTPVELAERVVEILWMGVGAQRHRSVDADRSEIQNA